MRHTFDSYSKNIEKVENYELAKASHFKGWQCHHRLETHTSDGERRLVDISKAELIALDMYYDRPAEELIFMTTAEHRQLHTIGNEYMKGKHHSEETRKKMSEALKGENNPFYGRKHSDEIKKKLSDKRKGMKLPEEWVKHLSEGHKGHAVSEETKRKISEAMKRKAFLKNKHLD